MPRGTKREERRERNARQTPEDRVVWCGFFFDFFGLLKTNTHRQTDIDG